MPNFDRWMSTYTDFISETDRAVRAWLRIQDKASSIVIKRGMTRLDPQTVRIEEMPIVMQQGAFLRAESDPYKTVKRITVTIYGVVGHPDTENVPDTDMREGDRFIWNNFEYEIMSLVHTKGELQALARGVN